VEEGNSNHDWGIVGSILAKEAERNELLMIRNRYKQKMKEKWCNWDEQSHLNKEPFYK